ncbi:hypothetical protein LshimejAT787_0311760 [Lyophyllum shimeji]|uniref:Uncharacterized protein n=1 Tax=Lyophyllum shimeji TaxID=47721 RepID=A0A9P3PK14_LYOSH|nr:hypothetical protein LshimejAT787_0311760 [Lyophyllum shimeji]
MTEYDFSPGAYARYLATQRRIADWVDHTEGHRPAFGNAFTMQPSMKDVPSVPPSSASHTLLPPPSSQTLRTSRSQNFYPQPQSRCHTPLVPSGAGTHCSGSKQNHHPPSVAGPSLRTSQSQNFHARSVQSQSRSVSRKGSSATLRDHTSARAPTYVASTGTAKPAVVYAPAGSVPSGGLVILPSGGHAHNPSVINPPPAAQPSHASHYQPSVHCAAQAYPASVSSHRTAVPPPPPPPPPAPPFAQKMYSTSGYAYQQNFHTGSSTPLIAPPPPPAPAPAHSSTVVLMQPIIVPIVERTRRSRSVGGRKGRKRDKQHDRERKGENDKDKDKEAQRSRSEVRGSRGETWVVV